MVYRKIVLLILVGIIGVIFLTADSNSNFIPDDLSKGKTGYEEYYLSPEMISTYTSQANNGDGDAAYRLGLFYNTSGNDRMKAHYWFEKGIQLNHMGCLFEFGAMFIFSNSEQRRIIALQCFNPIILEAEKGNAEAAKYVDKIPDDIKETAKDVDKLPDEKKEAAAKYLEKILDDAKKKVEESNE